MRICRGSIVAALFLLVSTTAMGQLVESGDLTDHIDGIIASMPTANGGGDYLQPNAASRSLWREIIDHILAGEYSSAHTKALTKNYQVVLFTDTGTEGSVVHVVLERTSTSSGRYWGTFVFNTSPLRPHLVIESPHPRYDTNTGYQSMRIYLHARAKAFFVSGTHRCNGLTTTPCDGVTMACDDDWSDYRYSDQAHVVSSTFQVSTQAMLDDDPELLVIQPHGFAKGSGDPDLIMSNGTRSTPAGTDFVVAIRDELQAIDPSLTAKVAHIDLSWTRLIATTNTQGRLMNGSSDPCGTAASTSGGGFVHIEQARPGLRDYSQNWMKLANAVVNAVPSVVTSVPDETIDAGPSLRILGNTTNPFFGRTRVEFEVGREGMVEIEAFDLAGRRVARLANGVYPSGVHNLDWNADHLAAGTYILRIRQGSLLATKRCIHLR